METPQPDDIPDPQVPAAVLQPDTPVVDLTQSKDVCAVLVHEELQALKLEIAALKQQQGSEEARITAQSPHGYQIMLITRKGSPGDLIAAVGKMQEWLKSAGYTANEIPF